MSLKDCVIAYIPPAENRELVAKLFAETRGGGRPPVWRNIAPGAGGAWLDGTDNVYGGALEWVERGWTVGLVLHDPEDENAGYMGRQRLIGTCSAAFSPGQGSDAQSLGASVVAHFGGRLVYITRKYLHPTLGEEVTP